MPESTEIKDSKHPQHCGRPMLAAQDGYTQPIGKPGDPIWYCPECGRKKPREIEGGKAQP